MPEEPTRSNLELNPRFVTFTIVMHFLAAMAFFVLAVWMVPKITMIAKDFAMELPAPTRVVIVISSCLTHYWYLYLAILGAGLWLDYRICSGLVRTQKTNAARRWFLGVLILEFAVLIAGFLTVAIVYMKIASLVSGKH